MKFTGERFLPNEEDATMEVEHRQRYMSIIPLVKGKVVVDAACGEGYGTDILSRYAEKVIGVDISDEAIIHAKSKYTNPNIQFIMSSVEKMDIPSHSVDVFVSFETIEHIDAEMQHLFLNEVRRILKEDGILIMSTPDKYQYSDLRNFSNPFHVKEFYKQEYYDFLNSYFSNIEFYYQRFELISLMASENSNLVQHIQLEDSTSQVNEGMYIIAVCNNGGIFNQSIDSYTLSTKVKYSHLTKRIICLQDEVEERNLHIRKLDEEIDSKNDLIVRLQQEVDERNSHIRRLNEEIDSKNELIIRLQQEIDANGRSIVDLENRLEKERKRIDECEELTKDLQATLKEKDIKLNEVDSEYTSIINNQQAHINLLLEEERKLSAIYRSGGWKLLERYYQTRDFVIPPNSKRRFIAKMLVRTLRHPKATMRHLNKENIKKFRRYLRTEKIDMLDSRVENFLERHTTANSPREITLMNHIDSSKTLHFQTVESPLVSIVIPVYNQWHYTYSCLASILEHSDDVSYEIIIADDVSTDDTVYIKDIVQNITVVRDEINRGFLLNCNNAAKQARGKYIVFLNNDTNVQEGWLSSLIELIESDNQIGMVGSKLVYPDGRLQEVGGIIWNDASGWNYGRLDDPEKPEYNYVKEVDYISGAAIMIRKNLWEQIGGFDERYVPAYFEDSDLAFEVRQIGYKVVLQPKSVVVHFEGISHGTDTGSGIKSYQAANKEKFVSKWRSILKNQHFPNGESVFLARDRSKDKKTILIIDHYVPHYDKDAGSRTMFQYIKLFVGMGLSVKFIGDNFYKHEPYTSIIEQMGVEVLYGVDMQKNIVKWLKANGQFIDFVYLLRPHIAVNYIQNVRKYTTAKVFYNGTDLHYIREVRKYKIDKNKQSLENARKVKVQEYALMEASDVVYTISEFEKDLLSKKLPHKRVVVIPTYIYETRELPLGGSLGFDNRKDICFVGGFSHTPNIDGVLWFVKEIFPKITKQLPDLRIHIIGSNPTKEILNLSSKNIHVTGFISDEELMAYYSNCRLVVAPLRFGAGVKGKIIEAIAYGIPIVTTEIGAEGISGSEDFLNVQNQEYEFAENVIQLYNDKENWETIRTKQISYAQSKLSNDYAISVLKKDIQP
ncbi:glycosyltransferase [Paenibacillus guangzhouensis]|uniref:glycosyltransferase n=1 Tax=Paenibacillus guangzhouensis TaxID=1473112 RepID=UPI0012675A82|nr:glycosyltransferase [Paenibacillus guangzhouensis]